MPVLGYCRNLRSNLCPCFVCGKKFSLDNGVEDLLTHICFTHRIVIEHIESIADFQKYMEYYLKRHQEAPLESFTTSFVVEVPEKDSAPREQKYHVLGNSKEDEELRKSLHAKRLKAAQKQHRRDLSRQYFARHCFYCHQTIEVTNSQFIHHLRTHGFYLGHPEKLVYIERFVEAIEDNFRNLQCLYCDAKFDSCHALKTHMVDKNHQKIHPNNRFYDQFYMINYLEFGKSWLDFTKDKSEGEGGEPDRENVDEAQDWSGWDAVPEPITCLFCKHVCRSWDGALLHMQALHNFDFKAMVTPLKFYHQVKVVNYIRRRIADNKCISCDFTSENNRDVVSHMETSQHMVLPEKDLWNQQCYFTPTKENDAILFHLEDDELDEEAEANRVLPVKQKAEILRHIEVENSESESGSSVCDDFCAMDVHEMDASSGSEAEVDASETNAALPKKTYVEIKHWSGDSNEKEDDADYDDVFESKYEEMRSKDAYANTVHTGAGDSVVKVTFNDESTKAQTVSELGEVGPKGDF